MNNSEFKNGDAVACRVRSTGEQGVLRIESDKIWVEFVGFGESTKLNADQPIFLDTAKGKIVSLFDNIDISPSIPFWRKGDVGTIYSRRILSNWAIEGPSEWAESDKVSTAFVTVGGPSDLLYPIDRVREISDIADDQSPDTRIPFAETEALKLDLVLSASTDQIRQKWAVDRTSLKFSFPEGVTRQDAGRWARYIESLFSLLTWRDLAWAELLLRPAGRDEFYSHRLIVGDVPMQNISMPHKKLLSVSVDSAQDREELKGILETWIENEGRWYEACGLMRRTIPRLNSVSAERTLDACRWYETLIRAETKEESLPKIALVMEAASAAADANGLSDYRERIASAISKVRGKPRKERISELIKAMNEFLNVELFGEASVEMCNGAYAVRNVTGHGSIGAIPKERVRALWGDTVAMEALCACLMMSKLPLTHGKQRLERHDLFRTFSSLHRERAVLSSPTP